MKLLIADDQMSVHRFLSRMIDWPALGITELKHAYDGRETAELAASFRPDLMLLDIQMPAASGLEALKRIRDVPVKPKTVILSAYDTFEYAREAIGLSVSRYLLKPIDAELLKEVVESLVMEAKRDLSARLEEELAGTAACGRHEIADMTFIREGLTALGFRRTAAITILGAVQAAERELGGVIMLPIRRYDRSREQTVLLGLPESMGERELADWCEALRNRLAGTSGEPVAIGLSELRHELSAIAELAEQSRKAAQGGFYRPGTVHRFERGEEPNAAVRQRLNALEHSIGQKLGVGFPPLACRGELEELVRLLKEYRVEPALAWEMTHRVFVALRRQDGQPAGAAPPSILEWMESVPTIGHIEGELNECLKSRAPLKEGRPRAGEAIARIREHIDANYDQDLSLQAVADRFRMDKYQISRLFKQEFRENYWQYVTRVRMEKAAEMLTATDWKNGRIAERTGFLEEGHFSRSFKKHYGVSPKEYRAKARTPERND